MNKAKLKKAGTFQLNKGEPIHGWYSYVEGYSSCLIADELDNINDLEIKSIYDPFGGTGTTPLVASQRNIDAYYSESNPYMLTVIDAKINSVKELIDSKIGTKILKKFKNDIESKEFKEPSEQLSWNGFEKFFDNTSLFHLLEIKKMIEDVNEENSKKVLMVALSLLLF